MWLRRLCLPCRKEFGLLKWEGVAAVHQPCDWEIGPALLRAQWCGSFGGKKVQPVFA